jgi:hypothetical protein
MIRHYEIRRFWPFWIVESLWDEGTDHRGRHYQLWKRVGLFLRHSSAESYKAWCERKVAPR